jgi:uncharacterized protein YcbK (DUF882 family)
MTRRSVGVRRWCDRHGYITPHFSWGSYAGKDGTPVPDALRVNAIRLHWKLETMRHRLGDVPMVVDGPYRTKQHNIEVGGAPNSRHTFADGADFFVGQVDSWPGGRDRALALAESIFSDGGVGNETTGTLHVDARGYRARFVTWVAAR